MTFLDQMLSGFLDIFKSPAVNLNVLWLLIPLFLVWLILAIYFRVFATERIGWDDVLTNGISTGWIMISLLAFLFSQPGKDWIRIFVIIGFLVYSLFLVFLSFKRIMPEKISFFIASPTMIFFLSFVAVVWSYDSLQMNWAVFVDLLILFALLLGLVEGLLALHRWKVKRNGGEEESPEELTELEEAEEEEPKA